MASSFTIPPSQSSNPNPNPPAISATSPFPSQPFPSPMAFQQGASLPSSATSPFNFLTQSPALPYLANLQGTGLTPNPNSAGFQTGFGTGLTPNPGFYQGNTPTLGNASQAGQVLRGQGGTGAGSVVGGNSGIGAEVPVETVIQGLDQMTVLLNRLEEILVEMSRLQKLVFVADRSATTSNTAELGDVQGQQGGAEAGIGQDDTAPRMSALQQEYSQILFSLHSLTSSSLIGALPSPISSATSNSTTTEDGKTPSMQELTQWAESRAQLEFSRREAVRVGAKAVLDVFKSR